MLLNMKCVMLFWSLLMLLGRDASRAYITGDFSEASLIEDLEGIDDSSLVGIDDWLTFYREEYKPVGMLI